MSIKSASGGHGFRASLVFLVASALAVSVAPSVGAVGYPDGYPDAPPTSDPAARAQALLAQMTLDEKVEMLNGEISPLYGFYNAPIERLGIPALTMSDGPAGVRVANPEVNGGKSTALPAPIALAASWDSELARTYGVLSGQEAFGTGHNVHLSPAADIFRDPRAGRGFEAFGEDPLLSGVTAAQVISGIQQSPVLADIKHIAAYNQETNRLTGGNAIVDERAFQELYIRPIGIAVRDGNPGSSMCAFNKINGVWACENLELLTTIMREQLHFEGFIMSDYNATHTTLEAFRAGLDQEQPADYHFGQALIDLVNNGTVSMGEIDQHVLNVLRPMYRFGLFDQPAVAGPLDVAAGSAVARDIAEKSMVLLKNDPVNGDPLLPLNGDLDSIAVIGADADTDVAGGGSSLVAGANVVSPLAGIEAYVGDDVDVQYSEGTDPIGNGAAILPGPDVIPSDVVTASDGSTTGFSAQYWTNLTREGTPGIDRIDPSAAIKLGFVSRTSFNAQSPKLPETGTEYFDEMSALWQGTLTVPVTGSYQFSLGVEGSGTLFIDDQPVANLDDAAEFSSVMYDVDLTAGDVHSLRLEYAHDVVTSPDGGPQVKLGWVPPEGFVTAKTQAAAEAAAAADVAIVVARDLSTEGPDKPDIDLPQGQDTLIREVSAANPNTVVVLTTGGAVEMDSWDSTVPAVLEAWYGGQEQGTAIANILFGEVDPSGRLPITFPRSIDQTPTSTPEQFPGVGLDVQYSEGIFVGYRGYTKFGIEPKYPFGYGLSYNDELETQVNTLPRRVHVDDETGLIRQDDLEVRVKVKNHSDAAGTEVIQVYAGALPGVDSAERVLAGWAKLTVEAGNNENHTLRLDPQSFAYWDTVADAWATPTGEVELFVGDSVETAESVGSLLIADRD
jgi:beta-glucosidase